MTVRAVSVVVCTRNHADLLPAVVAQLRAQEYPPDACEILVVDNCSTDQTPQVIARLAAESGISLRYVFEPRPGVTFARNRGAKEARFPYVAYCDDDCSVGPNWLQQLIEGFDLDPMVVAVGGLVVPRWECGRPSWVLPELEPHYGATGFLGTRARLLQESERIVEYNNILKREAWRAAGGFVGMDLFTHQHLAAAEGLYLLHRLRQRGGKIAFVPEALMYHHIRQYAPRRRILRQTYWEGVANALLDTILSRHPGGFRARAVAVHLRALVLHLGRGALAHARGDDPNGMAQLACAMAYLGHILGEMHLVGDWHRVRAFLSAGGRLDSSEIRDVAYQR